MLSSRCDPAALESQLCKPVDSAKQLRWLSRRWTSADPLLAHLGVRYLQVGGDTWNRCNDGWLNIDGAFANEGLQNYQIGTDDKGGHNMMVIFDDATVLPFRSQSVQMIYSEHMLEHLLPDQGGLNWIKELMRLLVPGGVLRLATPDLGKYMCSYAHPGGREGFLQEHARRFGPQNPPGLKQFADCRSTWKAGWSTIVRGQSRMYCRRPDINSEDAAKRPSDATIVNNIFRNYGHQWVYDFDEVVRLAADAGIPASWLCRSKLDRRGMPKQLERAVLRATKIKNVSLACWLDQPIRDDESLYVHIVKGRPWPNRTGAQWMQPFCRPTKGWLPCDVTMPPWHPNEKYPGGRPTS